MATLNYRRTTNLRAVQLLPGHTKVESTARYLGIEVDDALEIVEQTEVWLRRPSPVSADCRGAYRPQALVRAYPGSFMQV